MMVFNTAAISIPGIPTEITIISLTKSGTKEQK